MLDMSGMRTSQCALFCLRPLITWSSERQANCVFADLQMLYLGCSPQVRLITLVHRSSLPRFTPQTVRKMKLHQPWAQDQLMELAASRTQKTCIKVDGTVISMLAPAAQLIQKHLEAMVQAVTVAATSVQQTTSVSRAARVSTGQGRVAMEGKSMVEMARRKVRRSV